MAGAYPFFQEGLNMKWLVVSILLMAMPAVVMGASYVESIEVSPENPDPMEPFRILVTVVLPDRCLSEGPVTDSSFTVLDSYNGDDCGGGLFYYSVLFEREGLQEGHHAIIITEHHDGERDPGSWEHAVEFTVGDSPVDNESISWDAVKSLFH
jgi:hypothetical protein